MPGSEAGEYLVTEADMRPRMSFKENIFFVAKVVTDTYAMHTKVDNITYALILLSDAIKCLIYNFQRFTACLWAWCSIGCCVSSGEENK